MAKSLFVKGADYIAAMVFMFASTNLVIELGIVLVVLMGWQFAVSEFVGGILMIVLLATSGACCSRVASGPGPRAPGRRRSPRLSTARPSTLLAGRVQLGTGLRSKAGWANAASYTMADLKMLRRELVIGFTVGGFLAVVVPTASGTRSSSPGTGLDHVENAVVGPFIAIISFVCSIGNVPLAAAFWKGGISFGGSWHSSSRT